MSRLGKAKKCLKFLTRDEELQKLIAMPVTCVPSKGISFDELGEIRSYVNEVLCTLHQLKTALSKADNLVHACKAWAASEGGAPPNVVNALDELMEVLHGTKAN